MKKLLSLLILIISLNYVYGQASTRGALLTVDTSYKPTIKMLAVNVLDNEVVYWDLRSWSAVGGGGGTPSLTSNSVGFGNESGLLSGNSGFTYDGTDVKINKDFYNSYGLQFLQTGTNSAGSLIKHVPANANSDAYVPQFTFNNQSAPTSTVSFETNLNHIGL